jgi:arylsulfatase A-like enzyme
LSNLLKGEGDASRPEQFLMHYPHGAHRSNYFTVWRDGDWKVIHHALPEIPTHGGFLQHEGGPFQLFNLKDDPFEQKDLAKEQPDELKRLVAGMRAELDQSGHGVSRKAPDDLVRQIWKAANLGGFLK